MYIDYSIKYVNKLTVRIKGNANIWWSYKWGHGYSLCFLLIQMWYILIISVKEPFNNLSKRTIGEDIHIALYCSLIVFLGILKSNHLKFVLSVYFFSHFFCCFMLDGWFTHKFFLLCWKSHGIWPLGEMIIMYLVKYWFIFIWFFHSRKTILLLRSF